MDKKTVQEQIETLMAIKNQLDETRDFVDRILKALESVAGPDDDDQQS
jgi:hypothetical protein